jgi:PAS domain S-box-containing protein
MASDLLDVAPVGLLMVDEKGRVLRANAHAEKLFGYDRDGLVGQPVDALIPEGARDAHVAHRAHFAAEPEPREMRLGRHLVGLRRDGGEFAVEISLSRLPAEDGQWVVAAVRDARVHRDAEGQHDSTVIAEEDVRIAHDLGDTVIRGLFRTGLRLHSLVPGASGPVREELISIIGEVDEVIREIRNVIFDCAPTK